jgi:hypothetical protein
MSKHIHSDGEYEGAKACTGDLDTGVHIQTFTESYKLFFSVNSDPLFFPNQSVPNVSEFSPMQLLDNEQARILQALPSTQIFGPDLRTLPPIFRDTGIEPWLRLFDRRQLLGLLPELPNAATQEKSSPYAKLRRSVFRLFAQDLQLLEDGGLNPAIPHILTNGSQ